MLELVYRVNEGQTVKERVVAVIPGGIFVDVLGIEISIPNEELFYRRIYDARTKYTAGDVVDVKILSIDRSDLADIKVKGSVKQTKENPKDKGILRYEEGYREKEALGHEYSCCAAERRIK